jgi:ubiquinone/menaquinone biosynthesis C-methylase UbiE
VALERARQRLGGDAEVVELYPDEALPLDDSQFDLVLCSETLEHVRDVQYLLSEARRVLRPGGTLAVTSPAHGRGTALRMVFKGFDSEFDPLSPHLRFFTKRSLTRLLDELGFDPRSVRRQRGTLLATARR